MIGAGIIIASIPYADAASATPWAWFPADAATMLPSNPFSASQPIRFPAVTKHQSRFRISVSAAHSTEELERGAEIISNVLEGKTR